ncbi:MAG: cell wall-binding repeat-containing protein, partial [Nocardioidaceae bacterium]
GNMTVVKALQADSNSGVTGNVPTNAFLYFQTLGGTLPDGSFPAYNNPDGPDATPGTTINPLTDKCTTASTQGTSSDTCNQIGLTPGYLDGPSGTASGSGHTVDFLYSQNFFCDSAVSASSKTGCEAGANYTNLPPGTSSASETDPLYIITPIGFHPKSLQCPTQGYCIDHPTSVDLSRLAGPLGVSDPSTLNDVPLSPHDHIVLDRNNNQPEWWPVKVLGVTSPAVYNQINASTNRYQAYQNLVAAKNPNVTGAVDTNIFLWFQTLPGVTPTRLAGPARFQTAIATSQDEFPSDGTASSVVLARSDLYPDALTGAPLASAKNGPLLLTRSNSLQPDTKAEIDRVLPKKSDPIYLVGGTHALSPAVVSDLKADGYSNITRVAGSDRYATAVQVAGTLGDPSSVFLSTGMNFPDALTAGPAAIKDNAAILLTRDGSLPAATSSYLDSQKPGTVYAVGGPACRADTSADCVMGKDRYTTSANVADRFFPNAPAIGAATGQKFPDALTGGPDMALHNGPMMLVRSDGGLPPATSNELAKYRSGEPTVYLYGGPNAISAPVAQAVVLGADGVNASPEE